MSPTAAPSRYRHNSYAERVTYLAVAVTWWYCITTAMDPFGQGGIHSRRDLNKFLWLALSASPALGLCAFTSPYTTLGQVFRWVALAAIVVTAGILWPLLAVLVMWLLAAAFGVADGAGMFPFFVGVTALFIAFLILAHELMRTGRHLRAAAAPAQPDGTHPPSVTDRA